MESHFVTLNSTAVGNESSKLQLHMAAKIHEPYLTGLSQLSPTVMMEFRMQEEFMLG